VEPSEARKAFHALAYKKYKYLPLYLEWAPDNCFTVPASKIVSDTAVKESSHSKKVEAETTVKESKENDDNDNVKTTNKEDDDDPPEADTTLFVKNINFVTTEEQLADVSNLKLLYHRIIGDTSSSYVTYHTSRMSY
jgi:multiple RNA-binding domain-containing protein 1